VLLRARVSTKGTRRCAQRGRPKGTEGRAREETGNAQEDASGLRDRDTFGNAKSNREGVKSRNRMKETRMRQDRALGLIRQK
jgi:hypothetical protein